MSTTSMPARPTPRLDAARAELVAKTPRCREMSTARAEILNSGLAANVEMPHPIYLESGNGCRVVDADGNSYIDTSVGFGLHILGHRHPVVHDAIVARADKGWMFGIHSTTQMALAELMKDASPCADRVVFCNTGTEATFYAMRAARAFTGREGVALFDGCYHGAHDYGMVLADPTSPLEDMRTLPMGRGIPRSIQALQHMLPYRHRSAFDAIRRLKDELAVVVVEGVQSSNPQVGIADWLGELKEVCAANGVLFMLDEVITGFRLSYGGAQGFFGVTPDIATYGKVMGGGMPVGAITGRADIMEVFTGLAGGRGIFSGGTFSGNPMTMVAGAAAVGYLKDHPELYPYMNGQGDRLANAINTFCADRQLPVQMKNAGSMFHLFFQREPVESARDIRENVTAQKAFYLHALNRGVLVPGTQRAFLSAAHRPEDVDTLISVFQDALVDTEADGLFAA
jgi:glutamate-1-semialdehyde 2,1-aminomutase